MNMFTLLQNCFDGNARDLINFKAVNVTENIVVMNVDKMFRCEQRN